jgi:NTE family protein
VDAYAIFEGGGAKGLAHVGALAAAELREIEFKGVAGASAGAIVAALIAVGYRSIDMFDSSRPDDVTKIYGVELRDLVRSWRDWSDYEEAFREIPKGFESGRVHYLRVFRLLWKYNWLRLDLSSDRGLFSTHRIESYLDRLLESKLLDRTPALRNEKPFSVPRSGDELRIRFEHLDMPLKIVATDITNHRLVVFSKDETPQYSVAHAVGASICLPVIFKPHTLTLPGNDSAEIQAVDGGLLSNFPAWIFDRERAKDGPHMPTFGFRLVQQVSGLSAEATTFLGLAKGLWTTVLNGDPLLETREIENLHEIPLAVTVGTLDFDLKPEAKRQLFDSGFHSAQRHFDSPGFPREPEVARIVLQEIVQALRDVLDLSPDPMIRANIVCMTTRKTLRVTYSCYMDTDADTDDRLEFPVGSGACGRCWTSNVPIICDLSEAKAVFSGTWKMDKYQQAHVRNDLKGLVSYPICSTKGDVLGILNIDSPDPKLLERFMEESCHHLMLESAKSLVALLQPVSQGGLGDD